MKRTFTVMPIKASKEAVASSHVDDTVFDIRLAEDIDTKENVDYILSRIEDYLGDDISLFRSIQVNIGTLSVSDIRLFPENKRGQLRVTTAAKEPIKAINLMLEKLDKRYDEYIDKITSERKPSGAVYVRKYLKDHFGITPTFRYTNSRDGLPYIQLDYMLWDLPCFTDEDGDHVGPAGMDWDAFYELRDQVEDALNNELAEYVIHYTLQGKGSSYTHGAWIIECYS